MMGGSELQLLEEHLGEQLAERVEVSGSPCLDICNKGGTEKAPFVRVGERIVSEATISKVVAAIKEELNA